MLESQPCRLACWRSHPSHLCGGKFSRPFAFRRAPVALNVSGSYNGLRCRRALRDRRPVGDLPVCCVPNGCPVVRGPESRPDRLRRKEHDVRSLRRPRRLAVRVVFLDCCVPKSSHYHLPSGKQQIGFGVQQSSNGMWPFARPSPIAAFREALAIQASRRALLVWQHGTLTTREKGGGLSGVSIGN